MCLRRCSLGVLPAAYYAAHVPVMHGEKLLRAEKPQSCKFRKRFTKAGGPVLKTKFGRLFFVCIFVVSKFLIIA